MPTFTAGPGGIDMSQLVKAPPHASITGGSSQLTFLLQNQDTVVFTGQFTISNGSLIAANANEIQYFVGGSTLGFTITNASVALSSIQTFEGSSGGLLLGLVQNAMQGSSTYVGSAAGDVLWGTGFGPNTFVGGSGTETYDLNQFNVGTNTITGGSGLNIVVDQHITSVTTSGATVVMHEQSATNTGTKLSYIEGGGLTYVVAAQVHGVYEDSWTINGAPFNGSGQGATILFQDNMSNYTIQAIGTGGYTVTDLIAGHDGVTQINASQGGVSAGGANFVAPWVFEFADKTLSGTTAIAAAATAVTVVANNTQTQTTLVASSPNSYVSGGGYDIVSLPGKTSSSYSIINNGDGSVTLSTTGSNDHVIGALQIAFADKTVTIEQNNSGNQADALLYQAGLGRLPDGAGLAYWEKATAGMTFNQAAAALAPSFTHSAEFVAKYGTLSDAQFVVQMYQNVLDRAPDAAGLNYWVGQMAAGLTHEQMLTAFAVSSEDINNALNGFVGQSGAHASWLFVT